MTHGCGCRGAGRGCGDSEQVAKEFGVPVECQRFWFWEKRKNHTYHPKQPLTLQEELQSVEQLREISNNDHNTELMLFLKVELGQDLQPVALTEKTKEDILLFFKLYDPLKEELRYVGCLFVKSSDKPIEILFKLNEMAGFSPNEEIEMYEEVTFEPIVMCKWIDPKLTFCANELKDGDIVFYQKAYQAESNDQSRYPNVCSFLEYVNNRKVVKFRSLEKPQNDEFCLEMSKFSSYDDVVEKVAYRLGLADPSKIRLTSHNCSFQKPEPQPIKHRGVEHLLDIQSSDILYYEVLDILLPDLEDLKTLKVTFHNATKYEIANHTVKLPKQRTVGDMFHDLETKVLVCKGSCGAASVRSKEQKSNLFFGEID